MKKLILGLSLSAIGSCAIAQIGSFDSTFNGGAFGSVAPYFGPPKIISTGNESALVNTTIGSMTPFPPYGSSSGSISNMTNDVANSALNFATAHSLQFGNEQFTAVSDFGFTSGGKIAITGDKRVDYMTPNYVTFVGLVDPATAMIDANFNGGNYLTLSSSGYFIANQLEVQADDKIVIAGHESINNFFIRRYNSNGTIDVNFGNSFNAGVSYLTVYGNGTKEVRDMRIQNDGKILILGYEVSSNVEHGFIARFLADGEIDSTFGTDGITLLDFDGMSNTGLESMDINANGDIFVVGYLSANTTIIGGMFKLTSNGQLDVNLSNPFYFDMQTTINKVKCMSNNRVLVAGSIENNQGQRDGMFFMLNEDGTADSNFGNNGKQIFTYQGLSNGIQIYDFDVQADGKVIFICASFAPFQSATYAGRMLMSAASTASITETENASVSIYPNPAQEVIHLNPTTATPVTIRSLDGTVVYSTQIDVPTTIKIDQLAAGVYVVQTADGKTQRFIKY